MDFDNETRIVIYSDRFTEMRKFYEQTLSLKIIKEWDHGNGGLGVVYAMGNTYLEILQSEKSSNQKSDFYIYVKVKSIDDLHEKLQDKIKELEPINSFPWGHSSFSVTDPNGYKIKFFVESK